MRLVRTLAILLAVSSTGATLQGLVPATPVSACMCIPQGKGEHWREAAVIFRGRVLSWQGPATERVGSRMRSLPPYTSTIEMEVLRSWKGPESGRISLSAAFNDCGYRGRFEPGSEHLIWANEWPPGSGAITVSFCSPSAPIDEASQTIDYLETLGPRPVAFAPPALALMVAVLLFRLLALRSPRRSLVTPSRRVVVAAIGLGVAGIASIGIVALVESSLRDPSSNLQFSAGSIRLAGPDLRIVSIAPVVIMPLVFLLLGAGIRIRGRVWRGLIWGAAVYLLVGLGMQTGWNIWWRDGLFAPYAGAFLFWPAHLALTIGSFF